MAPLIGKLAPDLGSTPEAYPALRSIQSRKLFVMPCMWPEHIPRYEICCLQNLTKSSRDWTFFFVVGSATCNNLSFTNYVCHVPEHNTFKNVMAMTDPWVITELISWSLECMCLTKISSLSNY